MNAATEGPVSTFDCEVCGAIAVRVYRGQRFVALFRFDVDGTSLVVCRACSGDLGGYPVVDEWMAGGEA